MYGLIIFCMATSLTFIVSQGEMVKGAGSMTHLTIKLLLSLHPPQSGDFCQNRTL